MHKPRGCPILALLLLALVHTAGLAHAGTAPPPGTADRIVVEKAAHRLTLYSKGVPTRTYRIALGRHAIGAKDRAGDDRTPEGTYVIDSRNAQSAFYRALHISYPNALDRAHANALGVNPGGDVMIHGLRNGFGWIGSLHRAADWTRGCIAVTDPEMDEIWNAVPDGTVIEIRP